MTTRMKAGPSPEIQELKLDTTLLQEIVRRRKRGWVVLAVVVFAGLFSYNLFLAPQAFTATTSFSLQRPSSVSSPLAALSGIGAGAGARNYLGVLRSRLFAESVERAAKTQSIYRLQSFDDAVERIRKATKVEDNPTDGLMYVTVSLEGPARMAPDPNGMRPRVKAAAAKVANLYAHELLRYLKENDTDRDSAMQRQAQNELTRARSDYLRAVAQLGNMVRNRKAAKVAARADLSLSPAPGGATGSPATARSDASNAQAAAAASQIQQLYIRRARLEEDLRTVDVTISGTRVLLQGSPEKLRAISDEDPLLAQARGDVNGAKMRLDNLRISLEETNPRVVEARKRFAIAETNLKEKIAAILQGQTSESVRRQALQASYEEVKRQIAEAERDFQTGRVAAADYETLKNEVLLSLEALKTVSSRYAEMRLSTVSGQNRMTVIDDARPPHFGKPGIGMMFFLSLFGAVAVVFVWLAIEYVLRALKQPRYAAAASLLN